MKFFTHSHNPKANPLSKKMIDSTIVMFKEHGITGDVDAAKCALAFFQTTIRQVREVQSSLAKGTNTDKLMESHADEFKKILSKYGITDSITQEKIILNYMDVVGSIGG